MGKLVETANVNNRLSFADQEKKNVRFPFAENKQKYAV
jgi:hypothetical protein